MPETANLLETALENEGKLFLKLVNELENEDLYSFIRRVAEIKISGVGRAPTDEVVHVAQNVKAIEDALDNFYVA